MYQEVQLELDLRLGEDILWGKQVGDSHLHLIYIKFLKYSYIMLLLEFNCLNYSWIAKNDEINFG
jgi:hypothetical protein